MSALTRFVVDTEGRLCGAFGSGVIARAVITENENTYLLRNGRDDNSDPRLFVAEYLSRVDKDARLTVYPAFESAARYKQHITTAPIAAILTTGGQMLDVRRAESTGSAPWHVTLVCAPQRVSGIYPAMKFG